MFKDIFSELLQIRNITACQMSKETGISEALISDRKSGRQLPEYDSINLLCNYFDVSTDYLLGRNDNPNLNKGGEHIEKSQHIT